MRIHESMRMPRIYPLLGVLIVALGLAVSYAILAHAQEPSDEEITVSGITFPIAELGNCASKDACRDYCNESRNMEACVAFAEKHGLMNKDEAALAKRFSRRVKAGGGPGGCSTPKECRSFCSNTQNLEACVKFAEDNGITDFHFREGKKILEYIRAGGTLPGGCSSKEACEAYCGDFSHAEECLEFAQRAGITQVRDEVAGQAEGRPASGGEGGISPGQFQKFLELIKRGETPGGCKDKLECETYCGNRGHFEECLEFGVKAGFMTREQADKIKKLGGFKGPAGCDSPRACEAYCNQSENYQECLRFAEEHGFVNEEEGRQVREGFVRARAGFEQAPEEVKACLRATLGENIIEDIQSGKVAPGLQLAERMRACFEKFGVRIEARRIFTDAPPEVTACLREKLGGTFEKVRSGELQPTPEMADAFRVCFEKVRLFEGAAGGPPPEGVRRFAESAPPPVAECLKRELGGIYEKFVSGEVKPGPEIYERVRKCFEEFRPEVPPFVPPNPIGPGVQKSILPPPPSTTTKPFPVLFVPSEGGSSVIDCVLTVGGEELARRWQEGFRPEQSVLEKIAACIAAKINTSRSGICIQVITPAQDPLTGVCKEFPTPCDVPPGWVKGCGNAPYTAPSDYQRPSVLNTLLLPLSPFLNLFFR